MNISGFQYPAPLSDTVKKDNARFMQLCADYLNSSPALPNRETVLTLSRECNISEEEAYPELLAAVMGLETVGKDRSFCFRYLRPAVCKLHAIDYESDPYFRSVNFPTKTLGRWDLHWVVQPAYEAFAAKDLRVEKDGRLLPTLGYFDKDYRYPAVFEKGRVWMTLLPIEIETMKAPIARAKGRVLTYGLGLGYFAFHASRKPEVESVTVVETSKDSIELFRRYLLPSFPYPEKIRIVEDDAFHYAETVLKDGDFDFVFADIWHDAGDGKSAYLRLLQADSNKPHTQFAYWLEDTILCYLDGELWP